MDDIVKRLRTCARTLRRYGWDTMANHVTEAVLTIESLRGQLATADERARKKYAPCD